MAVELVTGKTCTFQYGTVQGEAQITTFSTEETADSESVETLGGTAVLSANKQYTLTVSFLFDGNKAGGGFYAALQASYTAGSAGAITLGIHGYTEAGNGTVTALSKEVPADGAVTCEATITCTGMTPTYPTAP